MKVICLVWAALALLPAFLENGPTSGIAFLNIIVGLGFFGTIHELEKLTPDRQPSPKQTWGSTPGPKVNKAKAS